jgi:hypothetical protein
VQQDEMDVEAEPAGGHRHLPAPVTLRERATDHDVAALGFDIGEDELELADLVAAEAETRHVVALDPDLRAFKGPG